MIFDCGDYMLDIYCELMDAGMSDMYCRTPATKLLTDHLRRKGYSGFTVRYLSIEEIMNNPGVGGKLVIEFSDPNMETLFLLKHTGDVEYAKR